MMFETELNKTQFKKVLKFLETEEMTVRSKEFTKCVFVAISTWASLMNLQFVRKSQKKTARHYCISCRLMQWKLFS